MRNLNDTELTILRRYKLVKNVKIDSEEYENLLKICPHYVHIGKSPDELYKYVVSNDVSEETLEQLERAEELKILYDNNRQLKAANKELGEIKEHLNEKLGAAYYCLGVIKKIIVGYTVLTIIAVGFYILRLLSSM